MQVLKNGSLRKKPPENWKSLRVAEYVRTGASFPSNLIVYRRKASPNIYAKYLPPIEDEWRKNEGRSTNGKRIPVEASLETDDLKDALMEAIKWVQKIEKAAIEKIDRCQVQKEYSLHKYWETWFSRTSQKDRRNLQSKRKFVRDTQLKWDGEGWGVKHQSWSTKRVDEITFADFQNYFSLLEMRSRRNNCTNGSGMKEQQKAFIRHLMKEARVDFPHITIPDFPPISRQTKQVKHLNHQQLDLLIRTIQELSDFAVNKELTYDQYINLNWSKSNRQNQRNWVDLYDAISLEWFYFLRSEDMYRLKSEWFQNDGDGQYECQLEETKGNRDIHKTRSFRPDADRFMRRMKLRRPKKGFLIFPEIPRPEEGGAENKVRNTLNFLLKKAVAKCLPDFDLGQKAWTTIRHTAIRLMLEDDQSLWVGHKLRDFAHNCHTSPDQVQTTYITPIQSEQTARQTRENIKSQGWNSKVRVKF